MHRRSHRSDGEAEAMSSSKRRSTRVQAMESAPISAGKSADKRVGSEEDEEAEIAVDVKRARTGPDLDSMDDAQVVQAIERAFEARDIGALDAMVHGLRQDGSGAAADDTLQTARSALKSLQAERQRLGVMLQYERRIMAEERERLRKQGCANVEAEMERFAIIGADEVGVGPLAGPCVGGAVCLRVASEENNLGTLYGVNDSKKLKPDERQALDGQIRRADGAVRAFALGVCTSQEVDMLNNRNASMEVMRRAIVTLLQGPLAGFRVHLLVDYHTVPGMPADRVVGQTCLEKGDAKSQSIAAASIVAKVHRDAYMQRLHARHPHFGFDSNAGYGTRDHMNALQRGLMCPEHRLSFAPVRAAYERCRGDPAEEEEQDDDDDDERRRQRKSTMDVLDLHYAALTKMQEEKAELARLAKLAAKAASSKAGKPPLKTRFEPNTAGDGDSAIKAKSTGLTAWLKKPRV